MIRTRLVMVSLLLATGAATGWAQATNALTPQERAAGWELLFDGKTLNVRDFFLKPDQWNHLQVTADGDHIVVGLNGETTLDIHDARFPEGAFRIQYQQNPIQFRNMKVRSLP